MWKLWRKGKVVLVENIKLWGIVLLGVWIISANINIQIFLAIEIAYDFMLAIYCV